MKFFTWIPIWGAVAMLAGLSALSGCKDDTESKMNDTESATTQDSGSDTLRDTTVDSLTDTSVDTSSQTTMDTTDDSAIAIDTDTAMEEDASIIFLHHSTGGNVWAGGVPEWFENYNAQNGTQYSITELAFPDGDNYPWENYPYDYWNIWVANAGSEPVQAQPTLEMLTAQYGVVVFKHCFPVSLIAENTGTPDVTSPVKTIENYQAQYAAIKEKLHTFAQTRFVVWTGAANVAGASSAEEATRARTFFEWVKNEWDEPGDNIYIWDFFELETEGDIFLPDQYAAAADDSHPNPSFCQTVAPLFANRVINVITGQGDTTRIDGL